jgi:hypothetical protein
MTSEPEHSLNNTLNVTPCNKTYSLYRRRKSQTVSAKLHIKKSKKTLKRLMQKKYNLKLGTYGF